MTNCQMHRALQVQEIVLLIMQNIRRDSEGFDPHLKGRKALYSAALTCSSFSVTALDALWYGMTTLVPLFKLLSNFLSEYHGKHNILRGSVLECDLKRFDAYASRIRRYFYQRLDADEDIDISAYIQVLQASGRLCLLPKLLNLAVIEANGADATIFPFLLSPCLHSLTMYGSSTSTGIVLNSLQVTTPRISCLTLGPATFNSHCISVICSLSHLQEITIHEHNHSAGQATFDLSFFHDLSCKETLRKFKVDWLHIIWSPASTTTVDLPSLESLNFHYTNIGPIAHFFGHVMVPGLQELTICLSPPPFSEVVKSTELQDWNRFINAIGIATTANFKQLKIDGAYSDHELWEGIGLTVSGFPDLSKLSLETFSTTFPFLCRLSQNDLGRIIHSWPSLSTLALSSCQPSKLDSKALVDIAVGLPHLKSLALPVDSQQHFNPTIPSLAHNLQYLSLDTSAPVLDFKFELVQFINRIFPYLKNCTFSHRGYPSEDVTSLVQSARDELQYSP